VSISPIDLLPKHANGTKFKLKKVDCALFLTPDPSFSAKIQRKLMALSDRDDSINQTSADFIKKRPLIASFELKRQTQSTDPLVQLSIWSAALAERLGKLQGQGETESELIALPVVSVVGHYWNVYYSYTTDEGERVSSSFLLQVGHRPLMMQSMRLTVILLPYRCYKGRVLWDLRQILWAFTAS
jgi:hypothetical protein